MSFTPRVWVDGVILTAADLDDLEVRLSNYTDLVVPLTTTSQSSAYTLVLGDAGTCIESSNASAETITVPPNSSVAFATGTLIEICQYGAGTVTIAPGSGVTLRTPTGTLTTRAQYSTVSLRKHGTNEWICGGDLT